MIVGSTRLLDVRRMLGFEELLAHQRLQRVVDPAAAC